MNDKKYNYSIKCGFSRRKVESLSMSISEPSCRGGDNDWVVNCLFSGYISESKEVEGRSAFDCLICGYAYLRQTLRVVKRNSPKVKFYFDSNSELHELEIDDIFMAHDCITDEMEEVMGWAIDNGYNVEQKSNID